MKIILPVVLLVFCLSRSTAQDLRPLWLYTVAGDGYDYSSSASCIASDGSVYSATWFMHGDVLGINGTRTNWTMIFLKFSSSGQLLWKKHYPTPNNTSITAIHETEDGTIVYSINHSPAINTAFKKVNYGPYAATDFGASFLLLQPDGTEVNLIEMPKPVRSCTGFLLHGDTLIASLLLDGTDCQDPYNWNTRNVFKCTSGQVKAFRLSDGSTLWESERTSGSLLQSMCVQDVKKGKVLVTGFYHDGDLRWGKHDFEDVKRHNAVIALLDERNGAIVHAENFIGDDLEMLNTASFGENGHIYAGGFSTGIFMKGPEFDFQKRSEQASTIFFELNEQLKVLNYSEAWGNKDSRVEDMVRHDSTSMWFIGHFADKEWNIFDTIVRNSQFGKERWTSDGYILRVSDSLELLQFKVLSGSDRVILQSITKSGSKLFITGYYEGEWSIDQFLAPAAPGTNAFFLLLETDEIPGPSE